MTKWIWCRTDSLGAVDITEKDDVLLLDRGDGRNLWGIQVPGSAIEASAGAFAAAALLAVGAIPPSLDCVQVTGEGVLAALLKVALGDRVRPNSAAAVVDTTGDPEVIAQAAAGLPRRGALLLAAPAREADAMMRTYADIHVRALSLIGVPWPGSSLDTPRRLTDFALDNLTEVSTHTAPTDGLWYRLELR